MRILSLATVLVVGTINAQENLTTKKPIQLDLKPDFDISLKQNNLNINSMKFQSNEDFSNPSKNQIIEHKSTFYFSNTDQFPSEYQLHCKGQKDPNTFYGFQPTCYSQQPPPSSNGSDKFSLRIPLNIKFKLRH